MCNNFEIHPSCINLPNFAYNYHCRPKTTLICKTSSYFFPTGSHTGVEFTCRARKWWPCIARTHRHTQTNNLFPLTCSTRRGTEGTEILWRAKRKKKKAPREKASSTLVSNNVIKGAFSIYLCLCVLVFAVCVFPFVWIYTHSAFGVS